MFFKKKPATDTSSRRRPSNVRGNAVVFSYHASRSARVGMPGRSAGKSVPGARGKSVVRRPGSVDWLKRVPVIAVGVIGVVLVGNSLVVSGDPEVITLADKQQQKVFLRSPETYQRAAHTIFKSSILSTNKLTIDTSGIAEAFTKQFPELEHVSVALPVTGHRPAIYIQPALPALLVKTADSGVYVLDITGRALISASQAAKIEQLDLPLVEDQAGLPVTLGKVALPSDNVLFIREIVSQLKAKDLSITGVVLPKGASEVDLHLEGVPYIVKFNLRGDARAEAGTYLAAKRHLDKEHKTPSTYIDVRVDNRVYYK